MSRLRPEEEWVAYVVAADLRAQVDQHDDGTADGMHDLDIWLGGDRLGAMEVTAAADGESLELWSIVNGKGTSWVETQLSGWWYLHLLPRARAMRLKQDLPVLLRQLERANVSSFDLRDIWRPSSDSAMEALRRLGVLSGTRQSNGPAGSIHLTIELPSRSGMVNSTLSVVSAWMTGFLQDQRQADVLDKLRRSGASERHVFIILPGFNTATFDVFDVPWLNDDYLVDQPPARLPDPVTHVWLASAWTIGTGLCWAPTSGWRWFSTSLDQPDERLDGDS